MAKGKRGRPPAAQLAIDKEELIKLLRLYPTRKEASDWFDVSESSMDRFVANNFQMNYEALRQKSFTKTRMQIKKAQIEAALNGSNVMLIWCGKQYLGQMDKMEQKTEISGPNNEPLIKSDEELKQRALELQQKLNELERINSNK